MFLQHFEKHRKHHDNQRKTQNLSQTTMKTLQYHATPFTTKHIHICYKFKILMEH
jgi:hypothetical protein